MRIAGDGMEDVVLVVFAGARGAADDAHARVSRAAPHEVLVRVPAGAVSGPLRLYTSDGTPSNASPPLEIDRGPTPTAAPGSTPAVQAQVAARRTFAGARRKPQLSFLVRDQAAAVAVRVVRAADGAAMATWTPPPVDAGTVQTVTWDGTDPSGHAAPTGRYEFQVYAAPQGAARAAQAGLPPTAAESFLLLDHEFPVRGRHDYGDAAAAFGAGRDGHTHQGQDVMAACGTPLVAARGGVVKIRQTQALAGNYVVIDEEGSDVDDVYMHLREPALVAKGERVYTGQRLGDVGRTGDATACHLHFELWSGPGWYTGGSPFDPLPSLKAWDAVS